MLAIFNYFHAGITISFGLISTMTGSGEQVWMDQIQGYWLAQVYHVQVRMSACSIVCCMYVQD